MDRSSKIYIAGHRGMVGSAIWRSFEERGCHHLIGSTHGELDLLDQAAVADFFDREQPDIVILAAARVGGIHANNTYPAEFIYQNMMIEANVIHQAYRFDVKQLLFLGSSCIYPKHAPQPIPESALLTGPLEPTNEPYAIAKIAGIKLCESYNRQYGTDFRCVMPTNLYGPGDNFHPQNSHVIPALMRRFHDARIKNQSSVTVWGTGTPRREFLHVDDLADACVYLMMLDRDTYRGDVDPRCCHINVGSGEDLTIKALATLLADVVGFTGEILFDDSRPDGTLKKLLDVSRLAKLGWWHSIDLREGLISTYEWFQMVNDTSGLYDISIP